MSTAILSLRDVAKRLHPDKDESFVFTSPTVLITWLLILVTGWVTLNALRYLGELLSILVTGRADCISTQLCCSRSATLLPRSVAAVLVYLMAAVVPHCPDAGAAGVQPSAAFVINLPSLEGAQQY